MRGISQFLPSANSFVDQTGSMNTPVMLLLTDDIELEELVADALSEIGGISHLTRDAGDALETICGGERSRSCHNRFRTRPSWDDAAQRDQCVAR
jgi:hypothetical protein